MNSRERVLTTFAHEEPDRVPMWCGASPEFWEKAKRALGISDDEGLRQRFHDDFRRVVSGYAGPEAVLAEGAVLRTDFSVERAGIGYGQPTSHPLRNATLKEVHAYPWPDPASRDVSAIKAQAAAYGGEYAILGGEWAPFWHDAVDLLGMENLYFKMFDAPEIVDALMTHLVDFYHEVSRRTFDEAGDLIDIFFIGNDLGSQTGPLLGVDLFERFVLPHLKRLFDLGHGGAFLPETMYFWGMYTNSNYGWDRGDLAVGELTNRYIRREYTSSPELLAMMLDYYDFTRDKSFLREELLPMSDSLLEFWDKHYERDEEGHLVMYPAQALETLQDAKNPTPDVAGLKWVLTRLLELPEEAADGRRAFWTRLLKAVPPLPMAGEPGAQWVRGAEEIFGGRGNSENPELYAVFPFRLYGIGKPDLEIGRRTFEKRAVKGNTGWRQDDTQAALLGLTEAASRMVADRAKRKAPGSRFPAFWGPNFDWVPDQDHGGNLMRALQAMVLQADEGQIRILPAWPRQWNVDFKLHAPNRATVRGVYRDGKLEEVDVSPEIREKDVSVLIEGEAAE